MILLWGIEGDGPLRASRDALARIGAPVFFLDQARADQTAIELSAGRTVAGDIGMAGTHCRLADITAAYVRCHEARRVTPRASQDDALGRHADHLDHLVSAFLDVTDARVVNPAAAMATNGSKPFQSAIIARHGLLVPDTLVTTDREEVKGFAAHHGRVIYKSVSGIRSIVSRLRAEDRERLSDVAFCPTQFQQYIPGRDYRVHVIGKSVFASEIVSEADDYRYAWHEAESVVIKESRIPASVEDRCRALASHLGLVLAGIDLRLTPTGEWYCFEVNPSPAFDFYEASTGQAMAQAVAQLLAYG